MLLGKRIEIAKLFPELDVFFLKGVRSIYDYENGNRTNKLAGYCYEVAVPRKWDLMSVKIMGQTVPVITSDELEKLQETQDVEIKFTDLTGYIYAVNGNVGESFNATSAQLVNVGKGKKKPGENDV